jgi:DNA ligase-associated metallophosphoesterase
LNSDEIEVKIAGQRFILDTLKAIYWPSKNCLILSDLHLGKAGHFRKSGIAIPEQVHDSDYRRLDRLLTKYRPDEVFFLGDIFHSDYNQEWERFVDWLKKWSLTTFRLIPGNHDILSKDQYLQISNLVLEPEQILIDHILMSHEPVTESDSFYQLTGHIHPGIRLKGKAKQSLMLPCFYFGQKIGVLPAFGAFTGLVGIEPQEPCSIFAVTQLKVIPIKKPDGQD